jgi:hypothetical protein
MRATIRLNRGGGNRLAMDATTCTRRMLRKRMPKHGLCTTRDTRRSLLAITTVKHQIAASPLDTAAGVDHSPTYGKSDMKRARLTAALEARWNAAQLPLRLRENILF